MFLKIIIPTFLLSLPALSAEVLMVLTGADQLSLKNGEVYKTGYWYEEFAVPYRILSKAGHKITIATPKGNRPTVDQASIKYIDPLELDLKKSVLDQGEIHSLKKLRSLDKFSAVFFPGGHGPMEDMLGNADVARVLAHFHMKSKPTALLCHAPAVLVSTSRTGFLYKGYKLTAFSDEEEMSKDIGPKMKATPEELLTKAGAIFEAGAKWKSYIVVDRELMTGQNPNSSRALAKKLVDTLKKL